jgi:PEP-CTERM motif
MHKRNLILAALVFAVVLAGSSFITNAATITLHPVADTSLFQNSPNNNLGGHTNFAAGTMATGSPSRAVMKFDPSAVIPAGSIITSVTLTLNVTTTATSSASGFELHPLLVNWGEGNKTGQTGAAASTGEATWNARFASVTLWGTPGGQSGADYAATSSASTAIGGLGSYSFSSTAALVLDVQNWLDNPSNDFGWMLLAQDESILNTAKRFASREDGLSRGPVLSIDFTPVPEPSTLGLFGLGAMGLVWFSRRKRA